MPASFSLLYPTSPAFTPRYDQTKRIKPAHQCIPVGLYSSLANPEPQYLPPLWTVYTHPEGSVYFERTSVPRVVTTANLYDSAVQEKIQEWIAVVDKLLDEKQLKLNETMELYLEIDEEVEYCRYYLADHASRVLFWLELVESSQLGMSQTVSGDHLRSALEALYWQHAEYFPCHEATGLNLSLNELVDVFAQAQADHMTSNSSTFPYNAKQSKDFLQILKTFQGIHRISAFSRWTIARLWANVANYRTMNHHGQEVSRLSIDQCIIESSAPNLTWTYKLVSKALFGVPASYSDRFEKLWTDEIVNVHHWHKFADSCHTEWKACLFIGFALLATNLLLASSPMMISTAWSAACIFLSNAVIVSAIAMLLQHRHAHEQTAADAAEFLDRAGKGRSAFQAVSIQFSLPKVLLLWTLAASTVQTLLPFFGMRHTCIAFAALTAIICAQKICVACSGWPSRLWNHIRRAQEHSSKTGDESV